MRRLSQALRQGGRAASLRRAFAAGGDAPVVPLLIDGERVASAATEFYEVHNPATGALLCRTPQATPAELQRAFDSATAAQRSWRDVPVTVRPSAGIRTAGDPQQATHCLDPAFAPRASRRAAPLRQPHL
jgi:malonate-semialdehyde dehydrogenase (acetylating)/methylmalonate-semialdehyde dehydrogenase